MTITLITGANKGLGYETSRRLLEVGHTVLVGARDRQRGEAAARELGGTFVEIDPTDDDSVDAAAARVGDEYGRLDVLINNAGTRRAAGRSSGPDRGRCDGGIRGQRLRSDPGHARVPALAAGS